MTMRRIAVMTGGGDAPGMNPAIRAVVRTASAAGIEVYGIRQAYSGLLAGDFERLTSRDVSGIIQRGGTFCRRHAIRVHDPRPKRGCGVQRAWHRGLVVIGGDGSLRGAGLHTLRLP